MIWAILAGLALAAAVPIVLPLLWAPKGERRAARFAIAVALTLPAAGGGLLYLALGAPGVADQPYASRLSNPEFALEAEAAHLIARLQQQPDAAGYARLGEIQVELGGGRVGPEAGRSFAKALELDPTRPEARFFAGLALAQRGERDKALEVWRALEKDSAANAPWLPVLRKSIADLAGGP